MWCGILCCALIEITQPEFIIHVTEASCVILPVAEKLQFTTLASEENLQREGKYEINNVGVSHCTLALCEISYHYHSYIWVFKTK